MTARSRSAFGPALLDRLVRPEPLRWHALVAASAACAAVLANMLLSPARLWSPWLALALAAALAAHGGLVLARALRQVAPAGAPAVEIGAGTAAPEPAPRIDPGPPIFPDEPAATRPRRWIPRQPDSLAPVPRVAAFSGARIRPLPSPRLADVEPGRTPPGRSWPSWQPPVPADRIAPTDAGWAAHGSFPIQPPAEPESAAAGW